MSLFTCFMPLFSCGLSTLFIRIYGYGLEDGVVVNTRRWSSS